MTCMFIRLIIILPINQHHHSYPSTIPFLSLSYPKFIPFFATLLRQVAGCLRRLAALLSTQGRAAQAIPLWHLGAERPRTCRTCYFLGKKMWFSIEQPGIDRRNVSSGYGRCCLPNSNSKRDTKQINHGIMGLLNVLNVGLVHVGTKMVRTSIGTEVGTPKWEGYQGWETILGIHWNLSIILYIYPSTTVCSTTHCD